MTYLLRRVIGLVSILAVGSLVACSGPVSTSTPEGPAILATVRAIPTPLPPTPEGPGILATVRAMPTPLPPTPESPSIMATVTHLLATPTATPPPTSTPGPTPTPRAREASTITLGGSAVKSVQVRLSPGERMEGFYQTPKADVSFSIQGPTGNTVHDYGVGAVSNFQIAASDAGFYSLIFRARALGGFEPGNTTFSVSYSYEIYGR